MFNFVWCSIELEQTKQNLKNVLFYLFVQLTIPDPIYSRVGQPLMVRGP